MLPVLLFLLAPPPPIEGLWDAAVIVNSQEVRFRLDISKRGGILQGSILDGDHRITSTKASYVDGKLALRWDYYDSDLAATMEDGELKGSYKRRNRTGVLERGFRARPYKAPVAPAVMPAQFAGEWVLRIDGTGRATVMRALFRQSGSEVTGTIQRIDGDFGTLEGRAVGRHVELSHFDGIRATYFEADLTEDGAMTGTLDRTQSFRAVPAKDAAAKGLPAPPDPTRYTGVKNPGEALAFQAPDLEGHVVSSADSRFRGKVLIVTIMGSWCPNCHDEAPFYNQLYQKYKSKGLEIVALSFEYTGEIERDREQIRAFNRRHGVKYLTLLAGTTEAGEVQRVLPQLKDFGAFPTSIFIGRDGRVKSIHAGFAGPANPVEHEHLKKELEDFVVKLLSE